MTKLLIKKLDLKSIGKWDRNENVRTVEGKLENKFPSAISHMSNQSDKKAAYLEHFSPILSYDLDTT